MRRLWVYKVNSRGEPYQSGRGDWKEIFRKAGVTKWGGTWSTTNPVSLRFFQEMRPGDLVLAYQTDRRVAVGLCEVVRFSRDRADLYLRPVERFEPPVKLHELKKHDPRLLRVKALRGGPIQTIYDTTKDEAEILLRACGSTRARSRAAIGLRRRVSAQGYQGVPTVDPEVEARAVEEVRRWYARRGWTVESVERESLGYDLVCTKAREEQHVEVKGTSLSSPSFMITQRELSNLKNDPKSFLAVAVNVRLRSRRIHRWAGREALNVFRFEPLQYKAIMKKP